MSYEKGDVANEILEKTGLESRPINDYLQYHESEERGGVVIQIFSESMLEEDLSQMEKSETILDRDRLSQVVKESFRDALKMLGDYFPQEKMQSFFPGLKLSALDSYDFSQARTKVFVLSNDDFNFFNSNLHPDRDKRSSVGSASSTAQLYPGSFVTTEMQVDLSEKKVIVIKELPEATKDLLERTSGKLPRELKDSEKDLIALNVKATTVHEFLHNFDVAAGLPRLLKEGIIEWYAQQVANGEVREGDIFEDKGIWVGYQRETEGVSILIDAMLESGVSIDMVNRAFISSDTKSRQQVKDFLTERYGSEQAEKIWRWKFEPPKESLQFIVDLESKQDSNIGKFLKTYKKIS